MYSNILKGQVTQINTNVNDNLLNIVQIGNQTFVTNFQNYVIHSDDNFNTFSLLPTPSSISGGRKRLKFQNQKLYLLAASLSPTYLEFWESSDTGNTWTLLFDTSDVHVQDFTMFNSLNGIMYSSPYKKIRTSDGGHTWYVEPSIMYFPFSIFMYNDSIGVIPTQEKILLTNNRFINEVFQSYSNMSGVMDGQYINKDTLVFSSCVNVSGCYLIYSKNGGTIWESKLISNFDPKGLFFFNYNEGYVVGRGYLPDSSGFQGIIARTNNMGQSWTIYNTYINEQLNDIAFLNDSLAIITGENGTLLKWNKNSAVTSVIDISESMELSLFPNPSNDSHTLILNSKNSLNEVYAELLDVTGRILNRYKMKSNEDDKFVLMNSLTELSNGIYFYKIKLQDKSYSVKFIKH